MQAQAAVPIVLRGSWSEYARSMGIPWNDQSQRPTGAQPQPILTQTSVGTFQGSAIVGVLNADDPVYQDAISNGLGRG